MRLDKVVELCRSIPEKNYMRYYFFLTYYFGLSYDIADSVSKKVTKGSVKDVKAVIELLLKSKDYDGVVAFMKLLPESMVEKVMTDELVAIIISKLV